MAVSDLSATRRALHGVAELVMAGPQFRRSGTIRLRATPGGFGTVAAPDLRIEGAHLVGGGIDVDDPDAITRWPLRGTTFGALAEAAGVDGGAPVGVYHDGSGVVPTDEVTVDPGAAAILCDGFARGDIALRRLAPGETPVLWPEHFDLGISLDKINYGVSPGDSWLAEPYAYVGPWLPRTGGFWDAPFGAARPLRDLTDDALVAFLAEGRERAGHDPIA